LSVFPATGISIHPEHWRTVKSGIPSDIGSLKRLDCPAGYPAVRISGAFLIIIIPKYRLVDKVERAGARHLHPGRCDRGEELPVRAEEGAGRGRGGAGRYHTLRPTATLSQTGTNINIV
jgi:hypothetical protein